MSSFRNFSVTLVTFSYLSQESLALFTQSNQADSVDESMEQSNGLYDPLSHRRPSHTPALGAYELYKSYHPELEPPARRNNQPSMVFDKRNNLIAAYEPEEEVAEYWPRYYQSEGYEYQPYGYHDAEYN